MVSYQGIRVIRSQVAVEGGQNLGCRRGRVSGLVGTGKGAGPVAQSSWPTTFSPFASPELQDAEVPYENLPVDKGHLLPLIQPTSRVSLQGL